MPSHTRGMPSHPPKKRKKRRRPQGLVSVAVHGRSRKPSQRDACWKSCCPPRGCYEFVVDGAATRLTRSKLRCAQRVSYKPPQKYSIDEIEMRMKHEAQSLDRWVDPPAQRKWVHTRALPQNGRARGHYRRELFGHRSDLRSRRRGGARSAPPQHSPERPDFELSSCPIESLRKLERQAFPG